MGMPSPMILPSHRIHTHGYILNLFTMSGPFLCKVGGVDFHTTVEILLSVPDSFFQAALSKTWNASGANFIEILRDGTHFQHVLDFLRHGYLPRDPSGRCHLEKEVLEAVAIEADFYGLPGLVREIEQLVRFNMKGMKYIINNWYLNSGPSGGLSIQEYATYEDAEAVFEKYKAASMEPCSYVHRIIVNDVDYSVNPNTNDDQNIVINEETDPVTGQVMKEVFEDGTWKRPSGMQLLCIPLSTKTDDGALYKCRLRTYPDNRDYY